MELDVMEKRCKYPGCNRIIARRIRGDTDKHALAVYCSVQYCPKHRELVRKPYKVEHQREARKDCRKLNRQLRNEIEVSEQNRELLETSNQKLREQVMIQDRLISELRRENKGLKKLLDRYQKQDGEKPGFSALKALCPRRKA